MKERAKSARRMLAVQRHLHDLAESKYLKLKHEIDRRRKDQDELREAFSEEGALHGLFIDVTHKRIKALDKEIAELSPLVEAMKHELLALGGRRKNAERLAEDLKVELERAQERRDLDEVLEVTLNRRHASSKQDH